MAEAPLGEVLLMGVRLSFADIYQPGKPQKNDEGEEVPGKFKANGLMEKGTDLTEKNMAKLKAAGEAVKKKQWANDIPKLKAEKVCVRDGDQEEWEGYAGCYYISANNTKQPVLITRRKDKDGKWIPAEKGLLYSGCYVNMLVRLWAQDNKFGKRLNASLEAVQFVRDGEAFGSGGPIDPDEKFAGVDADEGEDLSDADDVSSII